MEKMLRAGVIGAGAISVHSHIPAYKAVPGVELAAVCDVNEQRVQSVAKELGIPAAYTDYREMLTQETLDLVSICSPNALHAPMAIAALESGANVLCEKPMALSYADAKAMVDTAKRCGKSLTVGFHMRCTPEVETLRQFVAGGKLGEVYYAKVSYLRRCGIPGYGSWFTNKDLAGGGAMLDIGCHITDLALWVLGHPKPATVTGATYAEFGPKAKGLGGWGADHYPAGARFDVDDLATAMVRFENGLSLTIEASWAGHGTDGQRVQLFGTEGGIEWNPKAFGKETPIKFFGENGMDLTEEFVPFALPETSSYQREIAGWVAAIRAGSAPLVTGEQAAMVVQIVEGIYTSAVTGREVVLV
ncbi:MAG: Gfo/Idh/MocA family protein [Anaerolineae bacterium]